MKLELSGGDDTQADNLFDVLNNRTSAVGVGQV